ncbi:MAG: hypothetical protein U9N42_07700 [Campylobacterota bacterium]|nr:hypothetical protein [Campylobacterota bacterium]
MDEKIYARGLYENIKDEINELVEKLEKIKTSMSKNINSDEFEVSELESSIESYKTYKEKISKKWMEHHELKRVWGFK